MSDYDLCTDCGEGYNAHDFSGICGNCAQRQGIEAGELMLCGCGCGDADGTQEILTSCRACHGCANNAEAKAAAGLPDRDDCQRCDSTGGEPTDALLGDYYLAAQAGDAELMADLERRAVALSIPGEWVTATRDAAGKVAA